MNERAKELFSRGLTQLGLQLTSAELGKFYQLATELTKWSRKINLTAIRGDEDIVVKHFLDSLTLLRAIGSKGSLLDIGSGGGFPALPVKIACHDLHVVSVDAVEKKIIFQRHAARLLGLHHFDALHVRGEELAVNYAGHFDWVVSRAFSDIPTFVRMALPLIKGSGKIVAMKGRGGKDEARAAEHPLIDMGARVVEVMEFTLPVSGDARSLVIIERF
ncbi:16S rRNA (guanine(527)-N(7))-methyltransferase RsmG [Geobacter sp. AOG1]|uniref:16S rRNA (guanine(527)-N(7))-methyltransferase RsmG n=1 Tax=Geobacter sp. AOG1 TaxID=1566346 RepID=UPI001CC634D9|nr:16S rRNA (guanine(527)-N(7))-methyltransferase RsmG [Geobacter sp. AOG1]GFE56986.1 ribosomal RNA small subunit methyltransferase G [Geobacter sp. AOG1]